MTIRFLLNGNVTSYDCADPTETVLEMLRYRLRHTGTKEGCAEGDCGACTVLLGELGDQGAMRWRAVNACILFVPMLDGRALLTVEGLAKDGKLHPVQQAMVDRHGSQCGFCTPGFVMSLYGRAVSACGTVDTPVADVLAGNLCRCTGYGPILAAGEDNPPAIRDDSATSAALAAIKRSEPLLLEGADGVAGSPRQWFAPRTAAELAEYLLDHPDAQVLAGATDVGLWVTKQHRQLAEIVWLGEVAELNQLQETDEGLTIGAGVRYSDAHAALARLHPELGELVRRIGGLQVRNSGTIGGNIANGSPIGDMPPALIALGARLTLRKGSEQREMALEDYFIDYGEQNRAPGEFVEQLFVPRPDAGEMVRIVKLSKRFASDITGVLGAFRIALADGVVTGARIAFGGMAGTPKRAAKAEAALVGEPWSAETVEAAALALAEDYQPLTDLRGSAAYRAEVAANLLRRLWLEQQGGETPLSLQGLEDAHG